MLADRVRCWLIETWTCQIVTIHNCSTYCPRCPYISCVHAVLLSSFICWPELARTIRLAFPEVVLATYCWHTWHPKNPGVVAFGVWVHSDSLGCANKISQAESRRKRPNIFCTFCTILSGP